MADFSIGLLLSPTIQIDLNDAAVTVAETARHELLHGCFGSNPKRCGHAVHRADQPVGTADIERVEGYVTQQRRELFRNLRAWRLLIRMSEDWAAVLPEYVERDQVRSIARTEEAVDLDAFRHSVIDQRGQSCDADPAPNHRDALGRRRKAEAFAKRTNEIAEAAHRHGGRHQPSPLAEGLIGNLQAGAIWALAGNKTQAAAIRSTATGRSQAKKISPV